MNSQERDQLNQLLKQLGGVKLTTKDAEAEAMIREVAAHQPDATYLLVQRALLLEQAVTGAKARIDELQHQLQSNQSEQKGGFLSNDPWAQPAANAGPVPGAVNYQTSRYAPQPQQAAASSFGGGSSFLGNIATTAAGVVAGSFLFQGIENLMGHHSSGFGQQPSGEQFTEQTIINNNYGEDAGQQAANNDDDRNNYLASNDTDNFQDDSFQDDYSDSDWS
ncbi:MAG: DUF2076 domain-containing protein [Methylobacter sp.]|jgi:hypothetical protein|nr:DUF2076 domain-containing protein [Methylobacter sp.]